MNEPTEESPKVRFEGLSPISKNNALKGFFGEQFEAYADFRNRKPDVSAPRSENIEDAMTGLMRTAAGMVKEKRQQRKQLQDLSNELRDKYLKSAGITESMKSYIALCSESLLIYGKQEDFGSLVFLNGQKEGIYSQDKGSLEEIEKQTYHMAAGVLIEAEMQGVIGNDPGSIALQNKFPPMPSYELMREWEQAFISQYGDRL